MSEIQKFLFTLTDAETGTVSKVVVANDGERTILRIGAARWLLSPADASAFANAVDGGTLDEARAQIARVEALNDALKTAGYSLESLVRALESPRSTLRKSLVVLAIDKTSPEEKEAPNGTPTTGQAGGSRAAP